MSENYLPLVGPYTPSHGPMKAADRAADELKGPLTPCICGGAVEHDMRWDADFCVASGMWLQPDCGCAAHECAHVGRPYRREVPAPPPVKFVRPARAARPR